MNKRGTPPYSPLARQPEAIKSLRSSRLCTGMNEADFGNLIGQCHMAYAEHGEVIWEANSASRFLIVVASGIIRITQPALGKQVVVELIGPGGCAGLLALLVNSPHPFSAQAVTNTWYIKSPVELWRDLVDRDERFRSQVICLLTHRLIHGFHYLATMQCGDAEQRLALALVTVASLQSPCPEGGNCVPITRSTLAEIAGATVETAIRVTNRWQRKGWIATAYRSVQVIDAAALQRLLA